MPPPIVLDEKGPPPLRKLLCLAKTGWTTANVEAVLVKLQQIGIRDSTGLASCLRHEDGDRLNSELRRAGQKGFGQKTLRALLDEVREYFSIGPAAGLVAIEAGAATSTKRGGQQSGAELVELAAPAAGDLPPPAAEPPPAHSSGDSIVAWLSGVRSGDSVFLFTHAGAFEVAGRPEDRPETSESAQRRWQEVTGGLPLYHLDAEFPSAMPSDQDLLRAGGRECGQWQRFVIEGRQGKGSAVCSGDCVQLRAHTGKLLVPAGDRVRAEREDAGDFPGWTIEQRSGEGGPLQHGTLICIRDPHGDVLAVQEGVAQLGIPAPLELETFYLEKAMRPSDLPNWEESAPCGWWRVTHRPSIWVHAWPDQRSMMPAAYPADTVLAMDRHCVVEGNLWLRLRDERRGGEQWARTSAGDCGFDTEIMEMLMCEAPGEDARFRHYCAVEAMHKALEQGRRAAARGDRPPSLHVGWFTQDFVADVWAASQAAVADRACGYRTEMHSLPAALSLVGDLADSSAFARRLLRHGYAVIDQALTQREASALAAEAERLDHAGLLQEPEQPTPGQRGDRIAWINETNTKFFGSPHHSEELSGAIALLKGVANALNPALSRHHAERRAAGDLAHLPPAAHPATEDAVLTVANKAMLATYPGGGARYIAHQDNMYRHALGRRGNPRELTAILYANPKDWDVKRDGGELKLYLRSEQLAESPEGKGHHEVAYIPPSGGKLVVFFSCLWHEVLPAYRERRAVTLWIYRPTVD